MKHQSFAQRVYFRHTGYGTRRLDQVPVQGSKSTRRQSDQFAGSILCSDQLWSR